MRTKKILALVLACVMLVASLVSCASAYDTPTDYITLPELGAIEIKYEDLKKEIDDQIKEILEGSAGQVFKSIIINLVGASIVPVAAATANGVMLIWRLLSYYFVMLISLLFVIVLEFYFNKKARAARLSLLLEQAEQENSSGEDDYELE